MASKRRLRRQACEGKIRHPDQESACKHASWASRRSKSFIVAYRCPHCGGFHIGHPPKGPARRRVRV